MSVSPCLALTSTGLHAIAPRPPRHFAGAQCRCCGGVSCLFPCLCPCVYISLLLASFCLVLVVGLPTADLGPLWPERSVATLVISRPPGNTSTVLFAVPRRFAVFCLRKCSRDVVRDGVFFGLRICPRRGVTCQVVSRRATEGRPQPLRARPCDARHMLESCAPRGWPLGSRYDTTHLSGAGGTCASSGSSSTVPTRPMVSIHASMSSWPWDPHKPTPRQGH